MFGGSVIEKMVTSFQNALYKNNFKNAITYAEQWISLSRSQIDEIISGSVVSAVTVNFNQEISPQ